MGNGQPKKLREALNKHCDTEKVRQLARLFGSASVTGKDARIRIVLRGLEGDGLKWALGQLDEISIKALAETAHDPEGYFNEKMFHAKYGKYPWKKGIHRSFPGFIDVFLFDGHMPKDLQARVREILPPPPEMQPKTVRELPEDIHGQRLLIAETETDALRDIMTVLHLIAAEKVGISPKRREITLDGTKTIFYHLNSGDFFPIGDIDRAQDAIRAYAWPCLIIDAQLARRGEKNVEITPEGISALENSAHENIRLVCERWLDTRYFDEINRLNEYYRDWLEDEPPDERRRMVLNVLKQYQSGEWIDFRHLCFFIKETRRKNPPDQKSQGIRLFYSNGSHSMGDWFPDSLGEGYVAVFLWEYLGTMGLVDVAYRIEDDEWTGEPGFPQYNQLEYVRITPLGAYCLGLSESYDTTKREPRKTLKVLPTLEVVVPEIMHAVRWETFFLDRIAVRTSEHVWKLDRKRIFAAMEQGITIDRIRQVLESGENALPDTVARFLEDIGSRESAVRFESAGLIFVTRDEATAELIIHERSLQGLCLRAERNRIIVPEAARKSFFKMINKQGYLVRMPKEK